MVTSFGAQSTQNNNKCPHGFPVGSCPICSGSGFSVQKDKNKPRKQGEMSYNECMAVWLRMQRKKEQKEKNELQKLEIIKENAILKQISLKLNKIQNDLKNYLQNLDLKVQNNPIKNLTDTIIKFAIRILIAPIINSAIKITNVINKLNNLIQSASEKISSVLGEIKNFFDNSLKIAKKAIKTILNLFLENENDDDEDDENDNENERKKLNKIKKFIKTFFKSNLQKPQNHKPRKDIIKK